MNLSNLIENALKTVKANIPEILVAVGVGGVVTTSYLTAKASFKASAELSEEAPDMPVKEQAKKVWKHYVPAAACGAVTITCIIASHRGSSRRTAAAVTAYSLTEKAFTEYRGKVVEQIGKNKEQKIRDEIAQDRVNAKPVGSQVIVVGSGHVLCCENYTGRYFRSEMEALRTALNTINHKILHDVYVTLDEFYYLVGLKETSTSHKLGWDSGGKPLELIFSTVLADNGEPCLAFDYNYVKPLK